MYQGETITTTISGFPVPVSEIANLYIIFRSSTKILIEKTFADCIVDGETVVPSEELPKSTPPII